MSIIFYNTDRKLQNDVLYMYLVYSLNYHVCSLIITMTNLHSTHTSKRLMKTAFPVLIGTEALRATPDTQHHSDLCWKTYRQLHYYK